MLSLVVAVENGPCFILDLDRGQGTAERPLILDLQLREQGFDKGRAIRLAFTTSSGVLRTL